MTPSNANSTPEKGSTSAKMGTGTGIGKESGGAPPCVLSLAALRGAFWIFLLGILSTDFYVIPILNVVIGMPTK